MDVVWYGFYARAFIIRIPFIFVFVLTEMNGICERFCVCVCRDMR